MEQELTDDTLLTVQVRDEELSILLERLAATDAMFASPVTTIRDVAELTEISPKVIVRILGDIRGPGDVDHLEQRLSNHESRLSYLEQQRVVSQVQFIDVPTSPTFDAGQEHIEDTYRRWLQTGHPQSEEEKPNPEALLLFICCLVIGIIAMIAYGIQAGHH